jgi:hypothetical protein
MDDIHDGKARVPALARTWQPYWIAGRGLVPRRERDEAGDARLGFERNQWVRALQVPKPRLMKKEPYRARLRAADNRSQQAHQNESSASLEMRVFILSYAAATRSLSERYWGCSSASLHRLRYVARLWVPASRTLLRPGRAMMPRSLQMMPAHSPKPYRAATTTPPRFRRNRSTDTSIPPKRRTNSCPQL